MQELSLEDVHIDELLQHMVDANHVELYLEIGCPPRTRGSKSAALNALNQYEDIGGDVARRLVTDILTAEQISHLEKEGALTFRYALADGSSHFEACVINRDKNTMTVWHLVPKMDHPPLTIRFFGRGR